MKIETGFLCTVKLSQRRAISLELGWRKYRYKKDRQVFAIDPSPCDGKPTSQVKLRTLEKGISKIWPRSSKQVGRVCPTISAIVAPSTGKGMSPQRKKNCVKLPAPSGGSSWINPSAFFKHMNLRKSRLERSYPWSFLEPSDTASLKPISLHTGCSLGKHSRT